MGENCLRCLRHLYRFDDHLHLAPPETREAFAAKWSNTLGIPIRPLDSVEEVVRNADIAVGGTTRTDIVSREPWVRRGATSSRWRAARWTRRLGPVSTRRSSTTGTAT